MLLVHHSVLSKQQVTMYVEDHLIDLRQTMAGVMKMLH